MYLLIPLGILLAAFAGILVYCYRTCFYAPSDRREDPYAHLDGEQYKALEEGIFYCTRRMEEAPCAFVQTRSHDGLLLSGRYYHTENNAPTLLLFHGYRSMALRDSAGGFLLGKKLGFNVLAVDQRAHGRSEGNTITFGVKERYDCLAWTEFINGLHDSKQPILLSGLSMGAATVLMASELDLPENVVGILADCPYSSPSGIIRKVAQDRHVPVKAAYPFIRMAAKFLGHFDLEACSAKDAVTKTSIPILLIHGEDDRFVPWDMSKEIQANCASPCQLLSVPSAGHGLCHTTDPAGYEKALIRFLWQIPSLQAHLRNNAHAQKHFKGIL